MVSLLKTKRRNDPPHLNEVPAPSSPTRPMQSVLPPRKNQPREKIAADLHLIHSRNFMRAWQRCRKKGRRLRRSWTSPSIQIPSTSAISVNRKKDRVGK